MKAGSSPIIFADSSALIAGLKSPLGSMRIIINLYFQKYVSVIISEQVIEETTRNIYGRFPEAIWIMEKVLPCLKVVNDPKPDVMKKFQAVINKDDLPIFVAAIKTKPDYLLTWDKKHFITPKVKKSVDFIICTPADFLQKYWK